MKKKMFGIFLGTVGAVCLIGGLGVDSFSVALLGAVVIIVSLFVWPHDHWDTQGKV